MPSPRAGAASHGVGVPLTELVERSSSMWWTICLLSRCGAIWITWRLPVAGMSKPKQAYCSDDVIVKGVVARISVSGTQSVEMGPSAGGGAASGLFCGSHQD